MVSDTVLKKLVEEFSRPREEFGGKSYINRRRDWFDKPIKNIRPLLLKDALKKLTFAEAERIYDEMTVGGPRLYPRTYIENGLEKIRASLNYLLYGDDPLEDRFYNFAANPESDYRLNGVGRAFASTALFLVDHEQHAIWNGAVDGGLEILGFLPDRKRGEHVGERYLRICDVVKELQAKCEFEDLSPTDEFIELIFHGKLGSDIFDPDKGPESPVDAHEPEHVPENGPHLRIQYQLVKIGKMRGYDVWVANNDKNRVFNGKPLKNLALEELPHFAGPDVLRIAKSIDVIWFKKNTAQPIAFFEIENVTSIFSGLLRLNDVKIDYPIPQAFIVAPKDRRGLFDSQIKRRTFAADELADICRFLSYDEVEKLVTSYEAIDKIL